MSWFNVSTNDLLMTLMVLTISTVNEWPIVKYRMTGFAINPLTLFFHHSFFDSNLFSSQFERFMDKEN